MMSGNNGSGNTSHHREGTNEELVGVLRKLADRLEAGDDVFVTVSAETFKIDESGEMSNEADISLGGKVPEELDPRLVLVGCIGNLIKTMNESIDLKGLDSAKAMELLGITDMVADFAKPKKKIIDGGLNRG